MTLKSRIAAPLAFLAALILGSCTQVSDTMSDNWPHWAGGEPKGMPPRPGTPGYAEFIAHGQSGPDAAPPAGTTGTAAAPTASPAFAPRPAAPAYAPPDDAVARGGLY